MPLVQDAPLQEPEATRAPVVGAATDNGPAYYMINCAHPTHFAGLLGGLAGKGRLMGAAGGQSPAAAVSGCRGGGSGP